MVGRCADQKDDGALTPFLALQPRIESGEMTHRDVVVYGLLCVMVAAGQTPGLADVGRIIGTSSDRHKAARRAVRKLEQLKLVRRVNTDGKPMQIVVHLPAG